jgi:hypothetical protein
MEFAAMQCNLLRVVDNKELPRLAIVEEEIMTNVLKLMLGAAIAALSIASPALAQSASQSDPSISAHHSKHLKKSTHRNGSDAFASEPRGGADLGAKRYLWGINP